MVLEGVVTNVAAFGAFVDVGVHQDGLVHVSAMSRSFVENPHDVVKSGEVVKVKVLDVDVPRQRISLTLRLDDEIAAGDGGEAGRPGGQQRRGPRQGGSGRGESSQGSPKQGRPKQGGRQGSRDTRSDAPPASGSMADALRRAGFGK